MPFGQLSRWVGQCKIICFRTSILAACDRDAWRRYQRHMDRKRKTTHLTNDAKQHFTAVRRLEESPAVAALRSQAEAYREVLPHHRPFSGRGLKCKLSTHIA